MYNVQSLDLTVKLNPVHIHVVKQTFYNNNSPLSPLLLQSFSLQFCIRLFSFHHRESFLKNEQNQLVDVELK